MKKLMLFVFVLSIFGNVFSMEHKSPYVKIKMVAIDTTIKGHETTVYFYPEDFERLLKDSKYKNYSRGRTAQLDKHTLVHGSYSFKLDLADSDGKIRCYMSAADAIDVGILNVKKTEEQSGKEEKQKE